jgi:mRNA interferase MazF
MEPVIPPFPGEVYWADLGSTQGREQSGLRPYFVVSSRAHIREVDTLVTLSPCTGRDRGWINHVPLTGGISLTRPTFVMTEQVRTVAREHLIRPIGIADEACVREVMAWVRNWIHAAA